MKNVKILINRKQFFFLLFHCEIKILWLAYKNEFYVHDKNVQELKKRNFKSRITRCVEHNKFIEKKKWN